MKHWLCNQLLACALRGFGVDLAKVKLNHIRPLADGGLIVVLDPIEDCHSR